MSKILIVEDNDTIIKGLKYSLEQKGYKVITASNFNDGINLLDETIDLVILDISLPDGNGYNLCEKINESFKIPTLFLSAKDDENDIVRGLELGAEDYITKPFGVKELLIRIDKILKRQKHKNLIVVGDTKIDLNKSQVFVNNNLINLTTIEYKILTILFTNLNHILTREKLLEMIWDIDCNFVNDNTLTVNIKRIREKLNNTIIKTIKGIGYMVELDES